MVTVKSFFVQLLSRFQLFATPWTGLQHKVIRAVNFSKEERVTLKECF